MDREKIKSLRDVIIVALGAVAVGYLFITRLFYIALPFLFSWGVAFLVRPLSRKIASRVKIPCKIVSLLLTLIVIFAGLGALVGLLIYAGREAWNFLSGLAENEKIYEIIEALLNPLAGIFGESEGAHLIEERIA